MSLNFFQFWRKLTCDLAWSIYETSLHLFLSPLQLWCFLWGASKLSFPIVPISVRIRLMVQKSGEKTSLRLVVEIPFIYIYLFFWVVISNIFLCLPYIWGFIHDPIWPSFFNHQDKVSKAFAKHNHPWSRFTKVKSWSDARLRFVGKGQTPGRVVEVVSRGAEFPHFLVLGKIHCKIWVFPKIPKMDSLWWLKWMIWGYHYFWKHPFTLW